MNKPQKAGLFIALSAVFLISTISDNNQEPADNNNGYNINLDDLGDTTGLPPIDDSPTIIEEPAPEL